MNSTAHNTGFVIGELVMWFFTGGLLFLLSRLVGTTIPYIHFVLVFAILRLIVAGLLAVLAK